MSRPLNILILGGGIAGLALAAALRQRSAHRVVVLERGALPGVPAALIASGVDGEHSDEPNAQDYGIAIAPNGTRMLQMLGVVDPVAALGGKPLKEISTRSAANEAAKNMPYPLDPSAPAFFCRRSAMVRALAHAAASPTLPGTPAEIHIKRPLADLDIHTATYGAHAGDLIVLADGLSKTGRAAVVSAHALPAELRDAHTAQLAYMGLVPAAALKAFPHLHDGGVPRGCLTNWTWDPPHADADEADEAAEMARRARAQQRLILYPLGDEALQLFAYQPANPELLERFPQGGGHGSRVGFLRDVDPAEATEVFRAYAPEVQELLRSCPTLDLAQIRDSPCLANWAAGRAVLVGDAAHATLPHTGQGSAQALEDAEALSYLLAPLRAEPSSDGTQPAAVPGLDEALATFVAVRTPRAHLVQRTARMLNGCMAPSEAQHMRDWSEQSYMMSMLTYTGVEQQLAAQS